MIKKVYCHRRPLMGKFPRDLTTRGAPGVADPDDEFIPDGLMRDDFIIPEVEKFEGPNSYDELNPSPMDLDAPGSPTPTPAVRSTDEPWQGSGSTRLREILQDVGQPQQPLAGGADEPQPLELDMSDLGE